CGPGMHLNAPDATHRLSIGLDITRTLLCLGLGGRSPGNYFVEASARSLPLASGSLDVVTAFASLPYVPHHAEWTAEIARVLRPGGHALLDLGNPRSLNAIVSRAEPGSSQLMVPPIGAQLRALRAAGLQILWRRCHQILP
ncbi:MAG: class I SAM-dependent methyltransferase, partial [Planctomycetes bacterium]|nr:class I SAM-dependent methyltransferase [Planctomycetota bacterium]